MSEPIVPRQLHAHETMNSYLIWKTDLLDYLKAYEIFQPFLSPDATWSPGNQARELRLMLSTITRFCPVISRCYFLQECTSFADIWNTVEQHFYFTVPGNPFYNNHATEFSLSNDSSTQELDYSWSCTPTREECEASRYCESNEYTNAGLYNSLPEDHDLRFNVNHNSFDCNMCSLSVCDNCDNVVQLYGGTLFEDGVLHQCHPMSDDDSPSPFQQSSLKDHDKDSYSSHYCLQEDEEEDNESQPYCNNIFKASLDPDNSEETRGKEEQNTAPRQDLTSHENMSGLIGVGDAIKDDDDISDVIKDDVSDVIKDDVSDVIKEDISGVTKDSVFKENDVSDVMKDDVIDLIMINVSVNGVKVNNTDSDFKGQEYSEEGNTHAYCVDCQQIEGEDEGIVVCVHENRHNACIGRDRHIDLHKYDKGFYMSELDRCSIVDHVEVVDKETHENENSIACRYDGCKHGNTNTISEMNDIYEFEERFNNIRTQGSDIHTFINDDNEFNIETIGVSERVHQSVSVGKLTEVNKARVKITSDHVGESKVNNLDVADSDADGYETSSCTYRAKDNYQIDLNADYAVQLKDSYVDKDILVYMCNIKEIDDNQTKEDVNDEVHREGLESYDCVSEMGCFLINVDVLKTIDNEISDLCSTLRTSSVETQHSSLSDFIASLTVTWALLTQRSIPVPPTKYDDVVVTLSHRSWNGVSVYATVVPATDRPPPLYYILCIPALCFN